MSRIYVPSKGVSDWQLLLADPTKHWQPNYSARTLAHCWEAAEGFPAEIRAAIDTSPALTGLEPLLIFPEWKVPLAGGRAASQNDVWVLARSPAGLMSIAVEGKVRESFGEPLSTWMLDASAGKRERLLYLTNILGLPAEVPGEIFYQLLHRTASAVIEAERFGASAAAMFVHSFSYEDLWFEQFQAFVRLYGVEVNIGSPVCVRARSGLPLYLAWVHGDERYLSA